jgi:hypothetical protein
MVMRAAQSMLMALLAASALEAKAEPGSGCPEASAQLMIDRASTLARFEQLPHACLKSEFMRCSREAEEGLLGGGEAAICSFTYEALLRRSFGGDFNALLGWWQGQRADGSPPPGP